MTSTELLAGLIIFTSLVSLCAWAVFTIGWYYGRMHEKKITDRNNKSKVGQATGLPLGQKAKITI